MKHPRVTALFFPVVIVLATAAQAQAGGGGGGSAVCGFPSPMHEGADVSGFIIAEQRTDTSISDTIFLTFAVAGTGQRQPPEAGELLTLYMEVPQDQTGLRTPGETLANYSLARIRAKRDHPRRLPFLGTLSDPRPQWCFKRPTGGMLAIVFTDFDELSLKILSQLPGPTIFPPTEGSATIFRVGRVRGKVVGVLP